MTPEGKVKKKITAVLKKYSAVVLYDMPVPGGFGKSQLDYTCCYLGRYLIIEAKAPGNYLTALQLKMCADYFQMGAKVFIISTDEGVSALDRYLVKGTPWAGSLLIWSSSSKV